MRRARWAGRPWRSRSSKPPTGSRPSAARRAAPAVRAHRARAGLAGPVALPPGCQSVNRRRCHVATPLVRSDSQRRRPARGPIDAASWCRKPIRSHAGRMIEREAPGDDGRPTSVFVIGPNRQPQTPTRSLQMSFFSLLLRSCVSRVGIRIPVLLDAHSDCLVPAAVHPDGCWDHHEHPVAGGRACVAKVPVPRGAGLP